MRVYPNYRRLRQMLELERLARLQAVNATTSRAREHYTQRADAIRQTAFDIAERAAAKARKAVAA
jgi:hypothetical protein